MSITLRSSDGETFDVDKKVAALSGTFKLIIDVCADSVIRVPNVTGEILARVVEYCNRHAGEGPAEDDDLKAFDAEFVQVDEPMRFNLILAGDYLNIKGLFDLMSQAIADID